MKNWRCSGTLFVAVPALAVCAAENFQNNGRDTVISPSARA